MADDTATSTARGAHGAADLPSVTVDTYNAELRDVEGFIGDRASKRAFQAILDDWRDRMRKLGEDPLGDDPTADIGKKKLDRLLRDGEPEAAGLIHGAIEDFAQELAGVICRFLQLPEWRGTQRIVLGGGLRASRVGELAIGRAGVLLKAERGQDVELAPIHHHPDEAGLIGVAHLVPTDMFHECDSILAADIGGTNMRVGVVELNLRKAADLSKAHVMDFDLWRHGDDTPTREAAVERLGDMLADLVKRADRNGHRLTPFLGIGCPGIIAADGTIERGGQNLPGNWEGDAFNLADRMRERLSIGDEPIAVVLHNDAVVQGLSEVPHQTGLRHWGVMTIGTGLGNARFTNRTHGTD